MLSMGVPIGAVKNKMESKGLATEVLDLGPDILMTRVLAMEKLAHEQKHKVVKAPSKGPKQLRWEVLDSDMTQGDTVWNSAVDFAATLADDLARSLDLFFPSAATAAAAAADAASSTTRQASKQQLAALRPGVSGKSVLDARRVQSIAIAMKKLKLRPGQLTWALRDLNQTVLNPQAVEIILSTVLWPANDDEMRALKNVNASGTTMHEVDALVWLVGSTIPDAFMRVNALSFKYTFESSVAETIGMGKCVRDAAAELVGSARLKRLLGVVLSVGNRLNDEPVRGFTLASLLKLSQVKSPVAKTLSVLDVVVDGLLKTDPDVFNVVTDLMNVRMARRVDLAELFNAVKDYARGLEHVKRMPQLEPWALEATRRLAEVQDGLLATRSGYEHALEFFGYPKDSLEPKEFFGCMGEFLVLLAAAKDAALERTKAEKRKQAQAEANAARAQKPRKERRATRKKSVFQRAWPLPSKRADAPPKMDPIPEDDAPELATSTAPPRKSVLRRMVSRTSVAARRLSVLMLPEKKVVIIEDNEDDDDETTTTAAAAAAAVAGRVSIRQSGESAASRKSQTMLRRLTLSLTSARRA